MQADTAYCTHITNIGEGRTRVSLKTTIMPYPGQFVIARYWPGLDPYLSNPVFPASLSNDGFTLELSSNSPMMPYLAPGAAVQLTGPFGQPMSVRLKPNGRVLLISVRSLHRLLPLAQQALLAGADVTVLIEKPYPLQMLDVRIEARRGNMLTLMGEHLDWAEKVYIDCIPETNLRAALQPLAGDTYALFTKTMPCGTGACQGCSVYNKRGWQLACVSGPFFCLSELE